MELWDKKKNEPSKDESKLHTSREQTDQIEVTEMESDKKVNHRG